MGDSSPLKGWYSRGYLPHFDGGDVPQFVTFRLYDSLPAQRLEEWRADLRHLTKDRADRAYRRRVEEYLDRGSGSCCLEQPRVGALVQAALLFFDGRRYRLHAWVVMPNHVHALFTPLGESRLGSILHSWKSYTGSEANRMLGREGDFWQREYFDRYIRDDRHYDQSVEYIEDNPVKAKLSASPSDWPFTSARHRRAPSSTSAE
jgi:REP element-mobilizing transposase RayT